MAKLASSIGRASQTLTIRLLCFVLHSFALFSEATVIPCGWDKKYAGGKHMQVVGDKVNN